MRREMTLMAVPGGPAAAKARMTWCRRPRLVAIAAAVWELARTDQPITPRDRLW